VKLKGVYAVCLFLCANVLDSLLLFEYHGGMVGDMEDWDE